MKSKHISLPGIIIVLLLFSASFQGCHTAGHESQSETDTAALRPVPATSATGFKVKAAISCTKTG